MFFLIIIFINISLSALILTIFENIILVMYFQILYFLILMFFKKYIGGISDFLIIILYNLIFLSILVISRSYKNLNFLDKYDSLTRDKIFLDTGYVVDNISINNYIFQKNGIKYLVRSSKIYNPGDIILLGGKINYVKPFYPQTKYVIKKFDFYNRYQGWLFFKGFNGIIYEQNSIYLSNNDDLLSFPMKIKKFFKDKLISLYGTGKQAGLILGMTIGDKSLIPKQDYKNFINSGLVHIIAVSGANIMIIVVFLGFILFFIPYYLRLFIILLIITIYAFVCGMDSSVFRALLMGGLSIIALFFGKDIWILKLFLISWIIMLLVNPYYIVYDLGFLLSFGALFGIIVFSHIYDKIKFKYKIKKIIDYPIGKYILPTLGASIGVFPILIFFTEKFNLINLLANILVIPIVPFVMLNGLLTTYINVNFLINLEKIFINYIYNVNEYFSNNGYYIIMQSKMSGFIMMLLIYSILIFIFIYFINKKYEN